MTLKQLVSRVNWPDVAATLKRVYGYDDTDAESTQVAFAQLRSIEPEPNSMVIHVEQLDCTDEDGTGVTVYGTNGTVDTLWALEGVEWRKWLGMEVEAPHTSEAETAAHCLYEMTWLGYNEDDREQGIAFLSAIERHCKRLAEGEVE